MTGQLLISEIFLSLQGESTYAGLPCVMVRLAGCPLRCAWCDTAYAFRGGRRASLTGVLARVRRLARPFATGANPRRLPLVEVTGGEPLAQPACLALLRRLCDAGFTVLLETSGAFDIAPVDPRVHRIMDLKCPGSGEEGRNRWQNLAHLKPTDEVKFVIASRQDYTWAARQVRDHRLADICPVLFSWAETPPQERRDRTLKRPPHGHRPMTRQKLAERIIADGLPVRFQVQMHKVIWPAQARGV